ncbi:hypothetical protein EUX98_g4289 [Antrodiella citrinella]|uniref:Uncharacterized protein n=1 Tax=Antrodiella citrinella TaxID=2447956 RepID=A0A4S4MVE7_9APHY|nr:hypothetical protein EUX98_g4289 [Antrodiella citrinella]
MPATISSLVDEGYETLLSQFTTLINASPPPFIYIHDPSTPRISASLLRASLGASQSGGPRIVHASVNAIACFTPRLFYDTVLNALADWTPQWEDGCENWSVEEGSGQRFNESVDAFVHGLKALSGSLSDHGKGKARETEGGVTSGVRMVIVVERAERLKDNVPDLVVPLTRLAELAQLDIATVFHSELQWDQIRPSMGASPDPFYMSVSTLSKQTILNRLTVAHPSEGLADSNTYHPALRPLYAHFVAMVYSVCSPFVADPDELSYIIAARWPGFVQPVLDEWKRDNAELKHRRRKGAAEDGTSDSEPDADLELDEGSMEEQAGLMPPSEDTRLRLTRLFNPSITHALENLYPRLTSAQAWLSAHQPPSDLLSYHPREAPALLIETNKKDAGSDVVAVTNLPRMAKFILVASFLASTNPTKTDMRMFGRGLEERKKRRRAQRNASPKKGRKSNAKTAVKVL